jgi:hypothetical protein
MRGIARRRFLYALPALAAIAAPTLAQEGPEAGKQPINRPAAAERLVRLFDFEPTRREIYAIPRHWDLAQDATRVGGARPGFPMFNRAELDGTVAFAGSGSVRLDTKGGSTCLRLDPGVIPVFPSAEYLISAKARTAGLGPARAALISRYLDKSSRPIPRSESRSDLITSPDGEWKTLSTFLSGGFPDAAFIQIDLVILQPEQFQPPALGKHQVWPQTFAGSAWFDDVAIVQLPRVQIGAGSPTNIITAPARPRIELSVRDLTGEEMTARLTVQDAAARTVDLRQSVIPPGQNAWAAEPRLPGFGWYRATLELETAGRRVGATFVDFAWVPTPSPPSTLDRPRLGLYLPDLPSTGLPHAAALVAESGAGALSLPIWHTALTLEELPSHLAALSPIFTGLRIAGVEVAFSLPTIPRELAQNAHIEPEDPAAAFAADPPLWTPYLLPFLDKFGQAVSRWELGLPGGPTPAGSGVQALRTFLERLVPVAMVGIPVAGDGPAKAPSGTGSGEVLISIPAELPPDACAELVHAWGRALGAGIAQTFILESLGPEFSGRDAASHLTKRVVAMWEPCHDPQLNTQPRLAIRAPWVWGSPIRPAPMPTPTLAAWRNAAECLRERRVVGRLPTSAGIDCYILAPAASSARSGMLIAWKSRPGEDNSALEAYLGDGPVTLVDIWGNRTPIYPTPILSDRAPRTPASHGRPGGPMVHRIPLTDEPTFIEGVDVELARLISSFRLDPAAVRSTPEEHEVAVCITNPWATRLDGRITILEPGGLVEGDPALRDRSWRINPRSTTFSAGPGQQARIPLGISFSTVEEAGPRSFIAEIELAGPRDYTPIRLKTALEITFDQLSLDLSYRFAPSPSGPDLVVEAQVTNNAEAPVTLELSGFAPDYPRAKASISDLATGQSATRRFVFPAGAAKLKHRSITVGVQDTQSLARVNKSITIE